MTRGFGLDAFKLNILSQKLQNQFHTNAQYKLLHNVDLNQAEQSKKYECLREIGGQKKGLNFKFGSKQRHELSGQFFCFYFCNKGGSLHRWSKFGLVCFSQTVELHHLFQTQIKYCCYIMINKFSTLMTSPEPAFQKCTGSCFENVSTPKAVSSDLRSTDSLTVLARIEIVAILIHCQVSNHPTTLPTQ